MSTRDRLSRLTADLLAPAPRPAAPVDVPPAVPEQAGSPALQPTQPDVVETRFPAVGPRREGRKTGPGEMLAFRGQMLAAEGEVTRLRDALQAYDGSLPTKRLDPRSIVPSRWANRHEASFTTADFIRFKADIELAEGNVQPILVRPLAGADTASLAGPEAGAATPADVPPSVQAARYEIVFGHRRHRACLELGLPVLAAIATTPLSDTELFAAMDRENRERADLSAWEQGAMYRKALEEQMFPSQRRLAEALGLSHTWVRKAIAVAELPDPVVQCFRSPLELQFKHAELIATAMESDRKGVLRRAEKLRQSERVSASAVVAALIGRQRGGDEAPQEIRVAGQLVGHITWDSRGQAAIRLKPGVLHADNVRAVVDALSGVLASTAAKV